MEGESPGAISENLNFADTFSELAHIISSVCRQLKTNPVSMVSRKQNSPQFPFGICKKGVRKNQKAIFCDACGHWVHANCNGVKDQEYCELQEQDDDIPWFCLPCEISMNADLFPFGLESNLELLDLYSIDILLHLRCLCLLMKLAPDYPSYPTCKTLTLMKISFI